ESDDHGSLASRESAEGVRSREEASTRAPTPPLRRETCRRAGTPGPASTRPEPGERLTIPPETRSRQRRGLRLLTRGRGVRLSNGAKLALAAGAALGIWTGV